MKRISEYLVYLVVRIFVCVIQSVRIETCATISGGLAILACDLFRVRRQVVDENLQNAFPELDERQRRGLARRMWRHLFLMVCEVAHVPRKIHETNWRDHVRVDRIRELTGHLLEPRPTLVVSGHFGNFEVAGYICGLLGFPSFTIARPIDNPYLHRYLNRFRQAYGQYILPKNGSAGAIESVLASGGIISLLGDQNAGPKGCWVDFFGRPASCHKALALFTLTSGAPMVVAYTRRDGRPLQFVVGLAGVADPARPDEHQASVKTLTQWYNRRLEELIRDFPDQYWWLHRRWKGEPPSRRRPADQVPRAA